MRKYVLAGIILAATAAGAGASSGHCDAGETDWFTGLRGRNEESRLDLRLCRS